MRFKYGRMEKYGYSTPLHKNTGCNQKTISNTDHCPIPRKHCQFSMAGLLTCNIFAALPNRFKTVSGLVYWQKPFCVTYSCATVSDLHTIPY